MPRPVNPDLLVTYIITGYSWFQPPCRVDRVIAPLREAAGSCTNCKFYTPAGDPEDTGFGDVGDPSREERQEFLAPPESGACLRLFPLLVETSPDRGCFFHERKDVFLDETVPGGLTISI